MRIEGLWRYPVKSMQGEELTSAEVTERGIAGDRAYALVDPETGKVASAKNPKLWAGLFDCRAAWEDGAARITLPDGTRVRSDEPGVDGLLSELFSRKVTLAAMPPQTAVLEEYWPDMENLNPQGHRDTVTDETVALLAPGTFFDCAPLHLLTTSTLEALGAEYPEGRFAPRRYRPNILVSGAGGGFAENAWLGHEVSMGDVRARVAIPVPRCVMTTLAQDELPKDSGILRTAARVNMLDVAGLGNYPCVGVYATVETGGTIRVGDPIAV